VRDRYEASLAIGEDERVLEFGTGFDEDFRAFEDVQASLSKLGQGDRHFQI
jgi:hypothetical protein